MEEIYKEIYSCRLCGGQIREILDFEVSALANNFLTKEEVDKYEYFGNEPKAPLVCVLCQEQNCGSFQLKHTVNPDLLFKNYLYESSTSKAFVSHFEEYVKIVKNRFELKENDIILEIGSNDNILLKQFKKLGFKEIYGIEPARNLVNLYGNEEGINVICNYFSQNLIENDLLHLQGKISVICANNVYAHNSELKDITNGIKRLLNKDGVFIFEVTYLKTNIEKGYFDMQYHEHIFTHSVKPIKRFLEGFGLVLFDLETVNTHGGSIRCFVKKNEGKWLITQNVDKFIKEEEQFGLYDLETYKVFWEVIQSKKRLMLQKLDKIQKNGENIWAFGAAAKITTFFNVMGLSNKYIDKIVDDSPLKIGLFTPQFHIPVVSKLELIRGQPQHCLVSAWNFSSQIIAKNPEYKGNWILPFLNI